MSSPFRTTTNDHQPTYHFLTLVDDRLESFDFVVHQHAPRAFGVHEPFRAHFQVLLHALDHLPFRVVHLRPFAVARRRGRTAHD